MDPAKQVAKFVIAILEQFQSSSRAVLEQFQGSFRAVF